ncbi:hypothetical protein BDW62DRAFT_202538 [Aspergillus aurantiobrunneus]
MSQSSSSTNVPSSSQSSPGRQADEPVKEAHSLHGETPTHALSYCKRALCLLLFYLPILILPWIPTIIIMVRPIMKPSASARPRIFALADKGWSDIAILWQAWCGDAKPSLIRSSFLFCGLALILLGVAAIQPPLRQLLIQDEAKTVVTCNDQPVLISNEDPSCDKLGTHHKVIGQDPEPPILAQCPQDPVVQRTLNRIIDIRPEDVQVHPWRENPDDPMLNQTSFFTSSVINGTTTGVLRQHAVRMDTNVTCTLDENFSETCPGERPFTTDFSSPALEVSVCAEGSYDSVPWRNTREAQNVTERLWLHIKANFSATDQSVTWSGRQIADNFTMRCDSVSRRGWFELGNYQNGYAHQPMLETWPDDEAMQTQFNDFSSDPSEIYWPVKEEPADEYRVFVWEKTLDPFDTMTAALALFGNNALLHAARNTTNTTEQLHTICSVCEYGRVPFFVYSPYHMIWQLDTMTRLCGLTHNDFDLLNLSAFVAGFMQLFRSPAPAKQLLEITTFLQTRPFSL